MQHQNYNDNMNHTIESAIGTQSNKLINQSRNFIVGVEINSYTAVCKFRDRTRGQQVTLAAIANF